MEEVRRRSRDRERERRKIVCFVGDFLSSPYLFSLSPLANQRVSANGHHDSLDESEA